MGGRGFIFSLDAFVAFVLMAVAVSLIIFVSGTPKASYTSLEQAHQLAHDTLQALTYTSDGPDGPAYLDQILGSSGMGTSDIMRTVGGGDARTNGIIPRGYGFRLEKYNFNDIHNPGSNWTTLYDSGTDRLSDRFGKNYTKLQASATSVLSLYSTEPKPGESPYCYISCKGYTGRVDSNGNDIYSNPCNATPCDPIFYSMFQPGEHAIQLVRLIVYT